MKDHTGKISRRRFLRTALAGTGAIVAAPVFWRRPGWATVPPQGIHLTYGADPRTQMTVSWVTTGNVAGAALRFGPDSSKYGALIPAETRTVHSDFPTYPSSPSYYHHVRLSGLKPGESYAYRVEHADNWMSADLGFETAPKKAEPFTFTAFGDQGVNAGGISTTARIAAIDPAFHFHVGDLCYAHTLIGIGIAGPTDQTVWDNWFQQITHQASKAPWMTTVGNHEMEPGFGELGYNGYLARFSLPHGGKGPDSPSPVIYSFRYGNVGFIALDANDASYEIPHNQCYVSYRQDEWLRSTLAGFRADSSIDFIVVGFHHCAYCTNAVHASDAGPRERWGALFDELNVDLVINGHNHCYERTHPIRAGAKTTEVGNGGTVFPVADGTTYVTAGGGGTQPYPISLHPGSYVTVAGGARVPESGDWSATRMNVVSLLRADVTPPAGNGQPTKMTLTGLLPDGEVIETLTLERKKNERYGAPTPPENLLPFICSPLG